jgi:protein SCO1/2
VPQRVRLVLIGAFFCAFAAFAAIWIAGLQKADGQPRPSTGWSGALRPPGVKVPAFRLRDQDGKVVTQDFAGGKPAIYAFIYSHCQDTCPVEVQQIRGAMDQLGHDVPVIGISVDPANDTPASARAFLIKQHMTGRMHFLLGSRAQLRPVWRAFGIQPQLKGTPHSAYVVLVDGRGRQRFGYPHTFLTADGLAADLRRLGA